MASAYDWSSKGTAIEYYCRFSVDEEIVRWYNRSERQAKLVVEVRTNFIVEGRGFRKAVGSERFGRAVGVEVKHVESDLQESLGRRLSDYWVSYSEIERLMQEAVVFAKEGFPTVLNLEVRSVQQEGEAMNEAVDRALKPDYLAPLDLRPHVDDSVNPIPNPQAQHIEERFWKWLKRSFFLDDHTDISTWEPIDDERMAKHMDRSYYLGYTLLEHSGDMVKDVEKGLSLMQACGICGGKPFIGTSISTLRCGHKFHYHCIVRCPMSDQIDVTCPTCGCLLYDNEM